jgi:aquaporin Z
MKKYVVEFIGAFFLVFTVIIVSQHPKVGELAPFAVAGMYAAMFFAGQPISGGHYNPVLTLACLIRRTLDRGEAVYYWLAQFLAGFLASALAAFLRDCSGGFEFVARVNEYPFCTLLGEFLGVFALTYLFFSGDKMDVPHKSLALGILVLALSFGLGPISGAILNPSVLLGASMAGLLGWDDVFYYLFGMLIGAGAGASLWQYLEEG